MFSAQGLVWYIDDKLHVILSDRLLCLDTERRDIEREREKKKHRRRHVALRSTAQFIFTDPLLRIRMLLNSVKWICTGSKQTSYLRKQLCVPQACVSLKSLQCTQTCRFQALSTAVERRTSTCEVEKQRCRKLAVARE